MNKQDGNETEKGQLQYRGIDSRMVSINREVGPFNVKALLGVVTLV